MKTYIQPGKIITVTTPAGGLTSGQGCMIGNLFGIAAITSAVGDDNELGTTGVFDIDKDEAAFSVGDVAYWDPDNSKVSDASFSAGLTRIGVVTKTAATGDATVRVKLDGFVTRQAQL